MYAVCFAHTSQPIKNRLKHKYHIIKGIKSISPINRYACNLHKLKPVHLLNQAK